MLVIGARGVKALLERLRQDADAAELRLREAGWTHRLGLWRHPTKGGVALGVFAADDMRREEESNAK